MKRFNPKSLTRAVRGPLFSLGVLCLSLAATLTAVGHYDGVLGATPFDAFPAPGQPAQVIQARVVIQGTPADAQRLQAELETLGAPLASHFAQGTVVAARFEGGDARTLVFLQFPGDAPAPGEVLVVEGPVETLRVPLADGSHLDVGLLVLVHTVEVREPLLFKTA